MKTTTLTECEIEHAKEITKKRLEFDDRVGAVATPYGKNSLEKLMFIAEVGEVGFCKIFGCYKSLEYQSFPKYDVVYRGKKIDIKTSERKNSWLGVKRISHYLTQPPAGFGLMIVSSLPIVSFAGFISASSILNDKHYRETSDYGTALPHPMWTAEQTELVEDLGWSYENYSATEHLSKGEIWDWNN
jgi:hypothetical protein